MDGRAVSLIYAIIKEACYAIVHPLKAVNKLAKMLVNLADELTKPGTWSKIGAEMMGASLVQALITGHPISAIGLGIRGAMLIRGIATGALKAALKAEKRS